MGQKNSGLLSMMIRKGLNSNELSCTPEECLKCVVSLLKDSAYQWWNTIIFVVPRENVAWEFFQTEFKKKYISQRFLDQKQKEFLELKQGNMTVSEYEREFVRLSKYARECIPTKVAMCKRFEEGLNEDIKLLVGILELKEFVVLANQAHKVEKLNKEKRQAEMEARTSSNRFMGKPQSSTSKKSKKYHDHPISFVGKTEALNALIRDLRPISNKSWKCREFQT
ncbi:Hexaprenyldihydroxybenzoate methyltransferase, mitochondrial-like protein [Gossypium australe]|uniref:Hexaprenyldihydroxybenzoate methyltransferase, mitochondrial-like protein n=1 Tax=Gossypium australe TaxID=47621 RepID=A0A5B6VA93_9ROSI|nr:Hexaprenyldihydroxybenzoate methyltransferase, mitochondrial-like protein [Gossypium australe]